MEVTRGQMISFIMANFRAKGTQKLSRKVLEGYPDESLKQLIFPAHSSDFQKFVKAPKKMSYRVVVQNNDTGELDGFDVEAISKEACYKKFEKEGYKILQFTTAKKNHWCKACGLQIVDGINKEVLCKECAEELSASAAAVE